MKKILLVFLMIIIGASAESISNLYNVVGVEDGDTIYIIDNVGVKKTVQLIGIDAPERGQNFYVESGTALANAAYNKTVTVVVDSVGKDKELISTVYNEDGVNLNLAMIKFGYAWNCSTDQEFTDAQSAAKNSRKGLWQYSSAVPPWDYREAVAKRQKMFEKQKKLASKESPKQKISMNKAGEKAYTTKGFSSESFSKSKDSASREFSFNDKPHSLSGPSMSWDGKSDKLDTQKTSKEGAIGSGVVESQLANIKLVTTEEHKKENAKKERKYFSLEDGKYKTSRD